METRVSTFAPGYKYTWKYKKKLYKMMETRISNRTEQTQPKWRCEICTKRTNEKIAYSRSDYDGVMYTKLYCKGCVGKAIKLYERVGK